MTTAVSKTSRSGDSKLSAVIARKIQLKIIRDGWLPGTLFATESELIEQYGVSRAVIREALSQIESKGIARMRRGNRGGLVVSESAQRATMLTLSSYVELANADLAEIFEVRGILDTLSATLACRHISKTQATELLDLTAKMALLDNEDSQFAHLSLKTRSKIAEASNNPLLSLFVDAMDSSAADIVVQQFGELYIFKDFRKRIAELKVKLATAIVECDLPQAIQLAQENIALQLNHYKNHLSQSRAELISEITPGSGDLHLKRGHSVALKMSHDIFSSQLPEGTRLGSEPELMQKYDVSRAAFREAIRRLEEHSIVCTRRGSGGGLTVGNPDPASTTESILTFIDVMRLEAGCLKDIRDVLEVESIRLAVARWRDRDKNDIESAIAASRTCRKKSEILEKMVAVNRAICNASNNKTLALLTQITLTGMSRSYQKASISKTLIREVQENQQQLADAIFQRDIGLSARLIRRQHELTDLF
jgi:DNA-binding FadR family transcriptional regulator